MLSSLRNSREGYPILIATGNKHKLREIEEILSGMNVRILSPGDLGIHLTVEETGETLEENALIKARAYFREARIPTLADDTGLFVEALGGIPGVRSARFAGENASYEQNVRKLLELMKDIQNRKAYFETVIAFIDEHGKEHLFRGRVDGYIAREPMGSYGFGYDPIFIHAGTGRTFAQMPPEEKNRLSHRYIALMKFREFLLVKLNSNTNQLT